jgi:hypothetical protein
MRRPADHVRRMTLREIAAAVRREDLTLEAAYRELERRKALGDPLNPDDRPPEGP